MCFGLDLAQASSSAEESIKRSALAGDFGFRGELARRLFDLLLMVSEEDPLIFVGARTSSISAQIVVIGVLSACQNS